MSGIVPVQKGVVKIVGLVLVALRHPLQVKEELHIGDNGKPVHLIASVEEACIVMGRLLNQCVFAFLKSSAISLRSWQYLVLKSFSDSPELLWTA